VNILLDRSNKPTEEIIKCCVGDAAYGLLLVLESMLDTLYDLKRELRFWDSWQRGYWHKKTWLCDAVFAENGFSVTLTITDKRVAYMDAMQHELQPRLQDIWKNRQKYGLSSYPMTFIVNTEKDVYDLIKILVAKLPLKKA
jgi:hypothetical protein